MTPWRLRHALATEPACTLATRLVEDCQELAGSPAAMYAVDIEGACLLRVTGTHRLPSRVAVRGVGPELGAAAVDEVHDYFAEHHPEASVEPLWVRGRATAVVVTASRPEHPLGELAEAAGPLLELLGGYTDALERERRRHPVSASAELQQGLLSPRLAPVRGGRVAGSILPAYDVGGDWFDYADNDEGLWLAVADAVGTGPPPFARLRVPCSSSGNKSLRRCNKDPIRLSRAKRNPQGHAPCGPYGPMGVRVPRAQ